MVPSEDEVKFIEKYAGKTGVILDVGGNVGCMALTLESIRPSLAIHCFEPSPETFSSLKRNVNVNAAGEIIAHQLAVGEKQGELSFVNNIHSPALNRFLADDEKVHADDVIKVKVISIDDFVSELGQAEVAFLKIDVEGYEPQVIAGAAKLLASRRFNAGLVELCPTNLKNVGASVRDLLSSVNASGCALYFINADGDPFLRVNETNAEERFLANVALLPIQERNA